MNLNKVYLIGRLASDPEFRTTPSGQEVANIRLVTNRVWNDSSSGQKNEASEFHTVVFWGRLAQIANQYLNKGALAMIEGRLQTRSWEGQDGVKRYRTEIVAENLQLGPKPKGDARSGQNATPYSPQIKSAKEEIPVVNEEEYSRPSPAAKSGTADPEVEESEVKLEDIPF